MEELNEERVRQMADGYFQSWFDKRVEQEKALLEAADRMAELAEYGSQGSVSKAVKECRALREKMK